MAAEQRGDEAAVVDAEEACAAAVDARGAAGEADAAGGDASEAHRREVEGGAVGEVGTVQNGTVAQELEAGTLVADTEAEHPVATGAVGATSWSVTTTCPPLPPLGCRSLALD